MNHKIDHSRQSYTLIVERNPESGWLVGEVVELAGCMTEAPDLPALEAAIKEAIEGYLEVADMDEAMAEDVETMSI